MIIKSDITYTIAVGSLEEKCGCTYIVQALAKYIQNSLNATVCIVSNIRCDSDDIPYSNMVDILNMYDKYKYIIYDLGNLKECTEEEKAEFKRANKKLLMAKLEDNYLRQLADMIREDKKSVKKWTFLFNYVSPDMYKRVNNLMEDYEHYCLKIFNKDNPDKDTCKIFKSILKK